MHLSDSAPPPLPPASGMLSADLSARLYFFFYGIFKTCEANLRRCYTRRKVELRPYVKPKQGIIRENISLFQKEENRNVESDKTLYAGRRRRENQSAVDVFYWINRRISPNAKTAAGFRGRLCTLSLAASLPHTMFY